MSEIGGFTANDLDEIEDATGHIGDKRSHSD